MVVTCEYCSVTYSESHMRKHYRDAHGAKYSSKSKPVSTSPNRCTDITDKGKIMKDRLWRLAERLENEEIDGVEYEKQKNAIKAEYAIVPAVDKPKLDTLRLLAGDHQHIADYLTKTKVIVELTRLIKNGNYGKVFTMIHPFPEEVVDLPDDVIYCMYRTICHAIILILTRQQIKTREQGYRMSFDIPEDDTLDLGFYQPQDMIMSVGSTLSQSVQQAVLTSIRSAIGYPSDR